MKVTKRLILLFLNLLVWKHEELSRKTTCVTRPRKEIVIS
jgi:hypothetical protein